MEWMVYFYNINKNKIESYNIFNHYGFIEYAKKHIKKYNNKDEFADEIKKELRYYFWSKAEWELIIEVKDNRISLYPWCGCKEPEKVKIYVTDDKSFDWKGFAEHHINKQIYIDNAKIDVFDQVMFNWNSFVNYCWEHKKEILKLE